MRAVAPKKERKKERKNVNLICFSYFERIKGDLWNYFALSVFTP
jgi:hypothetical protein